MPEIGACVVTDIARIGEQGMSAQFILAFANRKGGVGKTTSAVNIAGVVASAGQRVLLVDLDQQDSCGELLGQEESDGRALLDALSKGTPAEVLRDVRPNLDLIPSGVDLGELPERLWVEQDPWSTVAERLASIIDGAGTYDLVVIDTPPGDILLTRAAMMVAQHLVIPVRPSRMSLSALKRTAGIFVQASAVNPSLKLAGAFFFDVDRAATAINAAKRAELEHILDGAAPVFTTVINHSAKYDAVAGDRGLLASELYEVSEAARAQIFNALRTGDKTVRAQVVTTAGSIASDYEALTVEILTQLRTSTGR